MLAIKQPQGRYLKAVLNKKAYNQFFSLYNTNN